MEKQEKLSKNLELVNKIEILINHGISIRTICETTGTKPEEIAKYICLVWSKKDNVNMEKLNKGLGLSNINITLPVDYHTLLENQGIKIKEKIMSK